MTTMYEKYGAEKMDEFANALVGTCGMWGPSVDDYGMLVEDLDDILGEIEELVYECARCGWWCDGSDRYEGIDCDGDVCGQCHEDEVYEQEEEDEQDY